MSTLLNKTIIFNHEEIVLNTVQNVIKDAPGRWQVGHIPVTEDDIRTNVHSIQRISNELAEPGRYDHSRIFDYADGDLESFNNAVRLQLQEFLLDRVPNLEMKVKEIQKNILVVGSKQAEKVVDSSLSLLTQNMQQLREKLLKLNWQSVAQDVMKTKKSPFHQLLHKIGLNGKALRSANEFLADETNLQLFTIAERLLRKSLNPFDAQNPPINAMHQLPVTSTLRHQFVEAYINAKLGDERIASLSLKMKVEEKLGEIIRELVVNNRQLCAYDYEVTQEIKNGTGIFISSKFIDVLSEVPRQLHIDPGYVKLQYSDTEKTKVIIFAVVPSIKCIPEIANMMGMVEERAQTDGDRTLYVTDIRTLYPQRYREIPGVSLDQATEILLKAFLVPNALEVFRARADHVDVLYPPPNGKKSFNTLDGFAKSITFEQEKIIHENFWLYYCENRRIVINQLDNFQSGIIGSGENEKRFHAMKKFAGATQWKNSIEKLLLQARTADAYYDN